jgi:hypothetical protein
MENNFNLKNNESRSVEISVCQILMLVDEIDG